MSPTLLFLFLARLKTLLFVRFVMTRLNLELYKDPTIPAEQDTGLSDIVKRGVWITGG